MQNKNSVIFCTFETDKSRERKAILAEKMSIFFLSRYNFLTLIKHNSDYILIVDRRWAN